MHDCGAKYGSGHRFFDFDGFPFRVFHSSDYVGFGDNCVTRFDSVVKSLTVRLSNWSDTRLTRLAFLSCNKSSAEDRRIRYCRLVYRTSSSPWLEEWGGDIRWPYGIGATEHTATHLRMISFSTAKTLARRVCVPTFNMTGLFEDQRV